MEVKLNKKMHTLLQKLSRINLTIDGKPNTIIHDLLKKGAITSKEIPRLVDFSEYIEHIAVPAKIMSQDQYQWFKSTYQPVVDSMPNNFLLKMMVAHEGWHKKHKIPLPENLPTVKEMVRQQRGKTRVKYREGMK